MNQDIDYILKLNDLELVFNQGSKSEVKAINNIAFDLKVGEILGIVGESGSGKSMTALSIMRLLPPRVTKLSDQSSIVFCKKDSCVDLLSLTEEEMVKYRGKEIGMIFQEPMSSLNPTMKCGKQVLEAVLLHFNLDKLRAKAKVIDLFKQVELSEAERIYESYPHQLSGGQVQRVMIAMAVCANPSILIADEPTTALDVTVQREILNLIKKIRDDFGTSTIFISHDLAVVNQLCDRVLVMQDGQIVESGNTSDIFKKAVKPYTRGLIASRPPESIKLKRLPTVDYFLNEEKHSKENFYKEHSISKIEVDESLKRLEESKILLGFDSVSKAYGFRNFPLFGKITETKALDNASFELRKGEILGVVGESGSGKSTLSKLACSLLKPSSGKVFYDGNNIGMFKGKELKAFRRKCQIIFQDPYSSLNPKMKIGHSIMEPFKVHNMGTLVEQKTWAIELLKDVGLNEIHFNRYPHEFSGGQRQRIVIARALALKPELLICDESVSALDVSIQAKVLNLLKDLKIKYDMSYLFISHDLSVVHYFADNILVMKNGKIIEKGSADQIYNHPKESYTKNLIAAIPRFIN